MKIVCESCGAKYSIADEKVAGKVFKIRCKRCSEVIVVRGDQEQPAPEAQAEAAYEAAPDAVWHVVINGDQQGPYTPAQLGEMITVSDAKTRTKGRRIVRHANDVENPLGEWNTKVVRCEGAEIHFKQISLRQEVPPHQDRGL